MLIAKQVFARISKILVCTETFMIFKVVKIHLKQTKTPKFPKTHKIAQNLNFKLYENNISKKLKGTRQTFSNQITKANKGNVNKTREFIHCQLDYINHH